MAATKQEIKNWVEQGKEEECTHVIIAVDTWDHTDYPIFIKKGANVQDKIKYYETSQDRIMEIYNMNMDLETQLNQNRCYNI
jgi:hypothetical protein